MALTLETVCPTVSAMTFRSIIELWPTRGELARELRASPSQVSKWWQRDFIPAEWWHSLLSTETAREAGLNAESLARLADRCSLEEARAG